jgi:hypothetical protein
MQTCKRIARSKVILYRLRPGIRSGANEHQFRKDRLTELVSKGTFPPRFTFGEDESGNLRFLQDEVVWSVVLDTVVELQLQRHIVNLDSLFCLAATAVSCALSELQDSALIDFTTEKYQKLYDNLVDHLRITIANDSVFSTSWTEHKVLTTMRLAQIA